MPAWYDWPRDVFLSYWLGTRTVGGTHGDRELAEYFRFLHIALAAWRVTGEACYRDWALRYGREHADMGGAICSVAAGHGRNWGCGAVTGCYGPLLMGTREIQGAVVPLVEWAEGHLPEQILALLQPPVSGPGTALFYNGSEEQQVLGWRMAGTADWQRIELTPGEVREYPL